MTRLALTLLAGTCQAGCALVSPVPLFELTKATGAAIAVAIPYGSTHASDTVHHGHAPFDTLCIELNPETHSREFLPALQAELKQQRVESRLYEGTLPAGCKVSLKYSAYIDWGIPPLGTEYQSYLASMTLVLRGDDGTVLSSSAYETDTALGWGKWSSTRAKLSPVVTALLTGFQD